MLEIFKKLYLLLLGFIWITGGTIVSFPKFKLDLTSLDLWMMGFILLLWIDYRVSRNPLYNSLQSTFKIFLEPKNSSKFFWILLFWIFLSLTVAHCFRHWSFHTSGFDLTFVHQALFYAWGAPPLKCDLCIQGTYFGEHLSFTLYLLSPLTQFFHSDELIFLIQAFLIAFAILCFFLFGPLRGKKGLWFWVLLILVSQRALRNGTLWDFKEDIFGFFFLSFSILSLYHRRFIWYFCFLVLALLSKENIAFIAILTPLPFLFEKNFHWTSSEKRLVLGLTAGLCTLYGWISFEWLIPYFNQGSVQANNIVERLPGLGSSPSEILFNAFTKPQLWIEILSRHLFQWPALKYLIYLFGPWFYFLVKRPAWILPTLPVLAMNLLSNAPTQRSLEFHYDFLALPFLIMGVHWSATELKSGKIWLPLVLAALCLSGRWPGWQIQRHFPTLSEFKESRFLSKLPDQGVTGVTATLSAQISHFREIRPLRLPSENHSSKNYWKEFDLLNTKDRTHLKSHQSKNAQYLLLDLGDPAQKRLHQELQSNPNWKKESDFRSVRFAYWKNQNDATRE